MHAAERGYAEVVYLLMKIPGIDPNLADVRPHRWLASKVGLTEGLRSFALRRFEETQHCTWPAAEIARSWSIAYLTWPAFAPT